MKNGLHADTLEKAWLKALRTILSSGELIQDEDPFLEIQNLKISYTNAFEIQAPRYKHAFGTKFIEYIHSVYSKEGDAATGRNYYKLIYEHSGINQVTAISEKLKKDPLTRSATIVLADANSSKQPCVTEINFSIRHELLHMTIVFKSSDLAKKFIPDMLELSHIHKQISHLLGISRGEIVAHLLCAQVYQTDIVTISKVLESTNVDKHFKTNDIIENWDKEAPEWDNNIKQPNHYVNIENGYSRFLDFINKEVPDSNDGDLAIDSGCGTGTIADVLTSKGYKVFGVDISPEMLRFAHKNLESTKYVLANSLDLPYKDENFNLACSRGVLISHIGKKYMGLFIQEHNRVLKTGGLFIFDFITHFNKSEDRYRRQKASINFKKLTALLTENGFEVINRSGTDTNRVNAISCRKVSK